VDIGKDCLAFPNIKGVGIKGGLIEDEYNRSRRRESLFMF